MTMRQDLRFVALTALVAPAVALLVLYVSSFAIWPELYSPRRIAETLTGFPIALIFAFPIGLIPAVLGATLYCVARHALRESWQLRSDVRFVLGGVVGSIVGSSAMIWYYGTSAALGSARIVLVLLVPFLTGALCAMLLGNPKSRLLTKCWSGP